MSLPLKLLSELSELAKTAALAGGEILKNHYGKVREIAYKDAGTGGPTLYRHGEGANLAFYDGHAERLPKQKVWIAANYNRSPKQPGMWVARLDVWNSYH